MSWQWNSHSGDDEIPSAPHSSPFDSSSAFNQMANDKAKEPDDTKVRGDERAVVNQTPATISKVRDAPLLLEDESDIAGATICFTPECSLSLFRSDTAKCGLIEDRSQASSDIAEVLAKLSPNSTLPSLGNGLTNLTAGTSLKLAKTTLSEDLPQPNQTKIPQVVPSNDCVQASKSMNIAEERHQDESRKMKETAANKIQAMIRSWMSKRGTFQIEEQGKSNVDNHEEAGVNKRSAIKGSSDINKSNSARSHRDTTKVCAAATACTMTLIVMLIFNYMSQGTFQVIEHADIDVQDGSSGQLSVEEEDDLHHCSTCQGFNFSHALFESLKGGSLSDQAFEKAVPGSGINLFVLLAVTFIIILLFCLILSQANLFQHVSKLLVRLDEKDSIASRITEEKIELTKKLATMQGLNDHLTLAANELVENLAKETGTNTLLKSEVQELRAELLQATSDATAAELNATSDIAAAESTIASLRNDMREMHTQNESLQVRLTEEKIKLVETLATAQGLNDHLQSKVEGLEDHHANELNKLLKSVGEKEIALSDITLAKNELVEKLAKETGTNTILQSKVQELRAELLQATSDATAAELKATLDIAAAESTIASLRSDAVELRREIGSLNEKLTESQLRVESEIQEFRAGLAQATAASAAVETSTASLCSAIEELRRENESRHQEVTDRIESEIQEARTNLIQATSAAVESTVTSNRDDMEELRRENSSLQDQVMSRLDTDIEESRASLSQATSAAAETESTIQSLRSEIEELRTQNESLQVHLNESQGTNSEEQEEDELAVPPTSPIGFEDVTTSTNKSVQIANGYRGLNWENVWVMHRSCSPGSGYERGIVSGDYVTFNGSGKPCFISSTTPFSVAGFQATAVFRTGLNVLVESFDNGGNRIGRCATTLGDPRDGPTFIDLRREGNFEGLYKLKITPSGGTDAGLGSNWFNLAIDDLRVY